MMLDHGAELDAHNRITRVLDFAEAQGFAVDRRASKRSSAVFLSPPGCPVVIANSLTQAERR